MSGVFDRAIATALRLIAKYGDVCTWTVEGAPTSDPATPWINTDTAPTSNTAKILFTLDSNSPLFELLKGTTVESGGQKAIMASVGFTPKADDTVVRSDGTTLALQSATALKPNGQIVMWRLVFKA